MNAQTRPAVAGRELLLTALSMGGVAWIVVQWIVARGMGMFPIPAGDSLLWDRTGDALRTGAPIYFIPADGDPFFYAPPFAVAFGALSWLPPALLTVGAGMLAVAALRLIAGSWRGAGLVCWFPFVIFGLADGNFNLLLAAGIVLAVRGDPRLASVMALAKLSPLLAIRPRDWRPAILIGLGLLAITLPWLYLWPQWIGFLASAYGHPFGPLIPVPFIVRLAVALGLLALRKPWTTALAATLAIPAFYYGSLVVLIAPLAVYVRDVVGRSEPA